MCGLFAGDAGLGRTLLTCDEAVYSIYVGRVGIALQVRAVCCVWGCGLLDSDLIFFR